MSVILQTENIIHEFKNGKKLIFPDITLKESEILALLGPSGSGKSTFLSIISGLTQLQQGDVKINHISIHNLNQRELDLFRSKHIGFIFQSSQFINSLNVIENLDLSLNYGNEQSYDSMEMLERVDLTHLKHKKIRHLSQGEKQRLAIARAYINKPQLILADEPTSALDDERTKMIIDIISEDIEERNTAVLIVTHDNRVKMHIKDFITLRD